MSLRYSTMSHWDRVVKRGLEHIVALVFIYFSYLRVAYGTPLVEDLNNPVIAIAWSSLAAVAGVLILVGLHLHSPKMGRATERIGWIFGFASIVGSLGYVVVAHSQMVDVSFIVSSFDDLLLAVGCLLRWEFLREESVAAREVQAIRWAEESS